MSGLLSSYEGHLRNLHEAWQENTMLLEVRPETEGPFLVATVTLGFLYIFKKSKASSPFEALNSECLSKFHRYVRPPVQLRRDLWFSLGPTQGIQTTLHLVR